MQGIVLGSLGVGWGDGEVLKVLSLRDPFKFELLSVQLLATCARSVGSRVLRYQAGVGVQ